MKSEKLYYYSQESFATNLILIFNKLKSAATFNACFVCMI